jgi:predicted O-methyltransferase YrrM
VSAVAEQRPSARHQAFLLRRAAASARYLRHIPTVALEDTFPGIGELEVTISHRFRPRGLPHGDAYVLALVIAHLHPRRIFEIGTGTGEATLLMARQAPAARIDTLDLGVGAASLGTQRGDLPLAARKVGEAFHGSDWAGTIEQHLGDSATFDFSPFRGQIDVVFVDGAHTARYVASDSRAAFAMANARGVVIWDDCHLYHPDVSRILLRQRRRICRIDGSRLAVWRATAHDEVPA